MISSMTTDMITAFLGWCSIINIALISLTSVILIVWKDKISKLHSQLLGLSQEDLNLVYIQYLANYKIAILILNIVPYIALKVMV
jgi:hypothetical protein